MGELDEALKLIKRSTELRKASSDITKDSMYSPYLSMGILYWIQGHLDQAASSLLATLVDREAKFGIDDREGSRYVW